MSPGATRSPGQGVPPSTPGWTRQPPAGGRCAPRCHGQAPRGPGGPPPHPYLPSHQAQPPNPAHPPPQCQPQPRAATPAARNPTTVHHPASNRHTPNTRTHISFPVTTRPAAGKRAASPAPSPPTTIPMHTHPSSEGSIPPAMQPGAAKERGSPETPGTQRPQPEGCRPPQRPLTHSIILCSRGGTDPGPAAPKPPKQARGPTTLHTSLNS
ncbi:extensin-like [Sphaeramia orbicularis]|uniref:extensin-like n=1 Tax=Sphaeramia orbicularis TaxID=375764 RepID=UPI00117BEDEA|nr:extensin-like [Sphaeramia orbicularis]